MQLQSQKKSFGFFPLSQNILFFVLAFFSLRKIVEFEVNEWDKAMKVNVQPS